MVLFEVMLMSEAIQINASVTPFGAENTLEALFKRR
jgi:hypothetical protein